MIFTHLSPNEEYFVVGRDVRAEGRTRGVNYYEVYPPSGECDTFNYFSRRKKSLWRERTTHPRVPRSLFTFAANLKRREDSATRGTRAVRPRSNYANVSPEATTSNVYLTKTNDDRGVRYVYGYNSLLCDGRINERNK